MVSKGIIPQRVDAVVTTVVIVCTYYGAHETIDVNIWAQQLRHFSSQGIFTGFPLIGWHSIATRRSLPGGSGLGRFGWSWELGPC